MNKHNLRAILRMALALLFLPITIIVFLIVILMDIFEDEDEQHFIFSGVKWFVDAFKFKVTK